MDIVNTLLQQCVLNLTDQNLIHGEINNGLNLGNLIEILLRVICFPISNIRIKKMEVYNTRCMSVFCEQVKYGSPTVV
jgi:hypothetical protein